MSFCPQNTYFLSFLKWNKSSENSEKKFSCDHALYGQVSKELTTLVKSMQKRKKNLKLQTQRHDSLQVDAKFAELIIKL